MGNLVRKDAMLVAKRVILSKIAIRKAKRRGLQTAKDLDRHCFKCNKMGHLASRCLEKDKSHGIGASQINRIA